MSKRTSTWVVDDDGDVELSGGSWALLDQNDPDTPRVAHLIAASPDLEEALQAMLDRYLRLVNSGDAGDWDPEDEYCVIAARAALSKARGESQ